MRTKAEAHEGLTMMFQRDGVPLSIIMDGSKEQTMGDFRKKARAAGCRIKQTAFCGRPEELTLPPRRTEQI